MPALQYQKLPADPLKEIKGQLHSQWQIEANALYVRPFKSQAQANYELAKLNSKYQQLELTAMTKMQQQTKERQRVQELIKQPRRFTPAQEAAERMRLGPEAERLAFPTEQKPFSFTQLISLGKNINIIAERAKEEPWRFGKKRTRKSLIEQYLYTIDVTRMEDPNAFGPTRRRQFNQVWNSMMKSDKDFSNWFDKKGRPPVEMQMLGAEGQIAGIMKKKALGVSPMATQLLKDKPRRSLIEKTYGTGREMRERYGFEPQEQKPIRQRNTRTGQERISYDGGKTWQMIGSR